MVTYLVGTDGTAASEAVCDYLEEEVGAGDRLEVINVLTNDEIDEIDAGQEALEVFQERFGDVASVETTQLNRGRPPTDEIIEMAEEIDADKIVTALRRHSRTERVIFGSVSHSLLQQTTIPITLVPLKEYQPEDGAEAEA